LRGSHALARFGTHGATLGGHANRTPALAALVSQTVEDRNRIIELRFVRPEIQQDFNNIHSSYSIRQLGA